MPCPKVQPGVSVHGSRCLPLSLSLYICIYLYYIYIYSYSYSITWLTERRIRGRVWKEVLVFRVPAQAHSVSSSFPRVRVPVSIFETRRQLELESSSKLLRG